MMLLPFASQLFVLILLSAAVTSSSRRPLRQCKLTRAQIEEETRLLAIRHKNGTLSPLVTNVVRVGQLLYAICNATDVISFICKGNGTFDRALPIQECESPMRASVEPMSTSTECLSSDTYRVGYRIDYDFLELYKSCYDREKAIAHFTQHTAYAHTVYTNRPNVTFTTNLIIPHAVAATFQARKIYDRFNTLLGPNQRYVNSPQHVIMDRGHLVPSGDYIFGDHMRATFKYINVMAQFSSINRGNWKTIETWIRNHAYGGGVKVITGTIDVLQLRDVNNNLVEMYLAAGGRNPIPKWVYKIVTSIAYSNGTVFLTYNNIYNINPPQPVMCKEEICPISLLNTKEAGFTFCCDLIDFQRKHLPSVDIFA